MILNAATRPTPDASFDVSDHPLVHDVNQEHADRLTPVERACKTIADWTGAPIALGLAVLSAHAELRAEHDHSAISRLVYHQEVQEDILISIAAKIECDVAALTTMVARLAAEDSGP